MSSYHILDILISILKLYDSFSFIIAWELRLFLNYRAIFLSTMFLLDQGKRLYWLLSKNIK